jgi:hypothetical protein
MLISGIWLFFGVENDLTDAEATLKDGAPVRCATLGTGRFPYLLAPFEVSG